MDVPGFRTNNPKLIDRIRSAAEFTKLGGHPQKDGTVFGWRWVPTATGPVLSISECSGCHTRIMPDGSRLHGAQGNDPGDDLFFEVLHTVIEVFLPGDSQALGTWRQYAVPWIANDIHDRIKSMQWPEIVALTKSNPPGTIARFTAASGIPRRLSPDRHPGPEIIWTNATGYADPDVAPVGAGGLLRRRRFRGHILDDKRRFSIVLTGRLAFAGRTFIRFGSGQRERLARRASVRQEGCGCRLHSQQTHMAKIGRPKDHPYRADMLLFWGNRNGSHKHQGHGSVQNPVA